MDAEPGHRPDSERIELFDTHCHLNLPDAFPDPDAEIEFARSNGVSWLCLIGIDVETSRTALDIAERNERVYASVGWHPSSAEGYGQAEKRELRRLAEHPKAAAIGEIGLDYHWQTASPNAQHSCLLDQLLLASEVGKPAVFHCRDAWDDLLSLLEGRPPLRYLFHCFSGTPDHAKRCIALGGLLGFDGPITFPKAEGLRQILRSTPRDRIVLETDSPYLAPAPFRGKPNRPAYLAYINEAAAAALALEPEECARVTTAAARGFFSV